MVKKIVLVNTHVYYLYVGNYTDITILQWYPYHILITVFKIFFWTSISVLKN